MENDLLRRAEDLLDRCRRTNTVTMTNFLTPAEVLQLSGWAKHCGCELLLSGGVENTERKVGFFLPEWLAPEDLDVSDEIRAVRISHRFGTLSHRDYLGSLLALGVRREWLANQIGKNESVRVVTSDSLIRLSALRSGVLRTSAMEFHAEVEGINARIEQAIRDLNRG